MTTRLAWLSDIHLNFLEPPDVARFVETVLADAPDAVLVGGDISEAHDVGWKLELFADALDRPVHFVLGNHDYYGSSIAAVRKKIHDLCSRHTGLVWLEEAPVVSLSASTALIGHGGWYDGRLGDYHRSPAELNDFYHVDEMALLDPPERLEVMHELADQAARYTRDRLAQALQSHTHVYYLAHVPPFREACWYEGQISDDDWLPFYSCKAVGDVLIDLMSSHPDRRLTVLCGHSHGRGRAQLLPNLQALTAAAEYGAPAVEALFDVD